MNISNDGGGLSMTGADNSESSVSDVSDRVSSIENKIDMFVANLLPRLIDCRSSNGYGDNPPYEVITFINFLGPLQIQTINVVKFLTIRLGNPANNNFVQFSGFTNDVTFKCKANFQYTDKYGMAQNREITGIIDKVFDLENEQRLQNTRIQRIQENFNTLNSKVDSFQTDINSNTSNIAILRTDVNRQIADITKNAEDILENKEATRLNTNDVANIKSDIAFYKNLIEQNQATIRINTEKINSLEILSATLENQIKTIKTFFNIQMSLISDARSNRANFMFFNGLHTKYLSNLQSYAITSITMMITDSNTLKYKNLPDLAISSETILTADLYIVELSLIGNIKLKTTLTNIYVDKVICESRIIPLETPFIIPSTSYITAYLMHRTTNKIVADFILNGNT